jgi:hypothetical protein
VNVCLWHKADIGYEESGDFPGTRQVKTVQYSAECWNERHFNNTKINQLHPETKLCTTLSLVNSFRQVIFPVAILNLSYFSVEFVIALNISSFSLIADSK